MMYIHKKFKIIKDTQLYCNENVYGNFNLIMMYGFLSI